VRLEGLGKRNRVIQRCSKARHSASLRTLLLAMTAAFLAVALRAHPAAKSVFNSGNPRVDKLINQMTLEEKISLLHGTGEDLAKQVGAPGYWAGLPRLGIPYMRFADGPQGVATYSPSTGMIGELGLAATFSTEDARQNGVIIGRDARALGIDTVLEPTINVARDPGGRGATGGGEDPLLTGTIFAAEIAGIQTQHEMAQAKTYVSGQNVNIEPQALHEIYVEPFALVADAGVSSFMCGYGQLNGTFNCGNKPELDILKKEYAYKGYISSDYGAAHNTLYIAQGLDMEMPGNRPGHFSYFQAEEPKEQVTTDLFVGGGGAVPLPEEVPAGQLQAVPGTAAGIGHDDGERAIGMLAALESGEVTEDMINSAVARILNQMDKFGMLTTELNHKQSALNSAANDPILLKTAEDAAILLKNDGGALPLRPSDLDSVAFIGPGARQTIAVGMTGENGLGLVDRQIGPVAALEKITGKKLTLAVADDMTGTPIPAASLSHNGMPGLLRRNAQSEAQQVEAELDDTTVAGRALPAGSAWTWTGTLTPPSDGSYTLALQVLGTSFASLSVDGKVVTRTAPIGRKGYIHPIQDGMISTIDGLDNLRIKLPLTAAPHEIAIRLDAADRGAPVQARLAWVTPDQEKANYDAAIAAAKNAKTAVVFAWGRGRPDPAALAVGEDKLIEDVLAVNPNTIVVLNSTAGVTMPWLSNVKAVVEMWFPGDQGGPATANLLIGRANPAGRLPISWLQPNPGPLVTNDPAHPERSGRGPNGGRGGTATYSEGIFVGYRWVDKQNLTPLFPFGYGLSYSSFEYSGVQVKPSTNGADVSFNLKNTGKYAGDEVAQIYVGAPSNPPADAQFAVKSLAGFDRVNVLPGQTKHVTIHLPLRQFQYWSTTDNGWRLPSGSRTLYVAASSHDVRGQAELQMDSLH
jgi:beta-glucosidase